MIFLLALSLCINILRQIMISLMLILAVIQSAPNPYPEPVLNIRQHYKSEIAINGLVSVGFAALSGIYWKKGNDAYDHYQNSMTTSDALYYWEQTEGYDRIRNICGIGTLIFITRTIYYYAKYMDAGKQTSALFDLKLNYSKHGSLCIGITKKL